MSLLSCLHNDLRTCVNLLLPAACPWCGALLTVGSDPADICADCQQGIQPLPASHCPCCAQPHATRSNTPHHCEDCLRCPPPFSKVHAVGLHAGSLKEAVHRFKYRDNPGLNISLGRLMTTSLAQTLGPFQPDLVAPVPLHPRRLRSRGYHQALELARPIARQLRVPLAAQLLQRVKTTPPQQGQNAADRQRNLRDAFAPGAPLAGEQILLIDDVMTTATTARECARVLREQGAGNVQIAVLGRA